MQNKLLDKINVVLTDENTIEQTSKYIRDRLIIKFKNHARARKDTRHIYQNDINKTIRKFIIIYSTLLLSENIFYTNTYKVLLITSKFRLVIRFHFDIYEDNVQFFINVITCYKKNRSNKKITTQNLISNDMIVSLVHPSQKVLVYYDNKEIYI